MSQSIRQQIAQKQAELAELERQAILLEKVESFQTFRDLADANPDYLKILALIASIKRNTLVYRPEHPEYLSTPSIHELAHDYYPNEHFGKANLYRASLVTDIFDFIIQTEKDENWIRDFKLIQESVLEDMEKWNVEWTAPVSVTATKPKKGK
jgi:hypothetical protein